MWTKRIRDLREDSDKNQNEISILLGIKREQYSRYERGVNELPIRYLKELCKIYNVSADYILGLPKGLNYPEN